MSGELNPLIDFKAYRAIAFFFPMLLFDESNSGYRIGRNLHSIFIFGLRAIRECPNKRSYRKLP